MVIFGNLLTAMQLIICFIYGFHVRIPISIADMTNESSDYSLIPMFVNFVLFMIVLLGKYQTNSGFGLLFAYERRLVWSSIGFTLLITCLTI